MEFANATNINRKSGVAKWSDLLCAYPPNNRILQQNPADTPPKWNRVTCTGSCEENSASQQERQPRQRCNNPPLPVLA
jgi:hypothetical protein